MEHGSLIPSSEGLEKSLECGLCMDLGVLICEMGWVGQASLGCVKYGLRTCDLEDGTW